MHLDDIHSPEYQTLPKYLLTRVQPALVKPLEDYLFFFLKKLKINSFNNHAAPFNLSFVENRKSTSGTTYIIEASHDLKKWGKIAEVQGTGNSVKFTDWREAIFEKQYYRVKLAE